MHDPHGWLIQLAIVQAAYLAVVIWGMRTMQRKLTRLRVNRDGVRRLDQPSWCGSNRQIRKNI